MCCAFSGWGRDVELVGAAGRQIVVKVGNQVALDRLVARIIPKVVPLIRVLVDPVELALGPLIRDTAGGEHAGTPDLLQPVRLADRALLVAGDQPAIAVEAPE